jgi:hypothetical protein
MWASGDYAAVAARIQMVDAARGWRRRVARASRERGGRGRAAAAACVVAASLPVRRCGRPARCSRRDGRPCVFRNTFSGRLGRAHDERPACPPMFRRPGRSRCAHAKCVAKDARTVPRRRRGRR